MYKVIQQLIRFIRHFGGFTEKNLSLNRKDFIFKTIF